MTGKQLARLAALVLLAFASVIGLHGGQWSVGTAAAADSDAAAPITGPPGVAMAEPTANSRAADGGPAAAAANGSYTHRGPASPGVDLPPGNGDVMTSTTLYYVYWLPTGQHFGSNATDDTNYENLLEQWANDLGSSQFHNLLTQYYGNNGAITNNVTFGGSWTDTNAYPHAGTSADPIQDSDIQQAVRDAVAANGWTEDVNHLVAVFTGNGIFECASFGCMSDSNGFCAYHDHFSDSGHDIPYAFMGYDNFTHHVGRTCVAGDTASDTDPNRGNYPNFKAGDAEVNTLSHEVIEAETDPHPNDTWTAPSPESEIGDACNFNFAPRNDNGADVFMNGHGYIMQQEFSNAAHNCAIDLPTNGFCSGSVSNVCSPTTVFKKSVDNASPRVLSTIHYTIKLNNTNDTGAETNLSLTDTAPSGYTVTALSAPNSQSSSFTSSSITVGYDTLAVHQSRVVTVTATVPTQAGTTATNCGSLAGSDLLGNALLAQTTSPCAATTPVKIPTIVTYTGATSGHYHDVATVSAHLTDDSFNPLSGKTIDFSLNGSETCSGITDGSGDASCQITPHEPAGSYTVTAAFSDSTDPVYSPSSTTATFTVAREETTTSYTGPTVILAGSGGATLTAKLVEDGANDDDGDGGSPAPVPAETVTLSVGSQSCTGTTDGAGNVSCTIPSISVPLGPQAVGASFAGDSFYRPSSDSTSAIVFAFPSRGAFVLGDSSVSTATPSTQLTWWSYSWSLMNNLTGGSAPSAFKGFAETVTLPTKSPANVCGPSFTTSSGNSSSPPSSVPSYMGVLVGSQVTKSGSTISGKWAKIVVVKTGPGYDPNPGHPGVGTIVATYCG